jgi:fructose-bisphosphate aldolase, class II
MEQMRKALEQSERSRTAIGHFNVSELTALNAAFSAARELGVPVIIGASEGERAFIGTRQIGALVRSLRDEYDYPIFLNADHTHTIELAIEAAKTGFDSVIFDASSQAFEENVRRTKQAVETLKSINPDILVEGEIGNIGSGSEVHEAVQAGVGVLSTAQEAKQFVEATKVDVLAPAVGNMHGLLKSMIAGNTHKRLNIDRIREIKEAVKIPLTLHGASGTDSGDLKAAIEAGIDIVHVSTELRLAWRRGVETAFREHPDEVVPYKLLADAYENIRGVCAARLQLFSGLAIRQLQ